MISLTTRAQIAIAAGAANLDPAWIEAFVTVESGGNPWAWNPEPRYRYLWNVRDRAPFRSLTDAEVESPRPPADFPCLSGDRDQEWWGQRASWGLLQIMGSTAREFGCVDPYLTVLCDPKRNLQVGCRVLRGLLGWANGNPRQAAAAYNAGKGGYQSLAGQTYAQKVLGAMTRPA